MNEREMKIRSIQDYLQTYLDPKPEYTGVFARFMAVQILENLEQIELDYQEALPVKNYD